MQKSLYTLLFLLTAAAAGAQQMPERSLVRKGNRQYAKGNYEESIRRYEQALEAVPGQFEATYDLGNALYKAERFDRAEQTLRQAAADTLRPETELAEAYYNLGNAQFKQQKYKEALESYKQSLRLNPSDMEAKYNYAYTKRLLDQDQNGGGGNDQQNQDQDQDQNHFSYIFLSLFSLHICSSVLTFSCPVFRTHLFFLIPAGIPGNTQHKSHLQ